MWPYPSTAQNLLKVYADAEIVLVSLIGMALRITDSSAGNFSERATHILVVLLMCTIIPTVFALLYTTPVDRAQAALHGLAKDSRGSESARAIPARPAVQGRASTHLRDSQSTSRVDTTGYVTNPTFKAATRAVIATGRVQRIVATDSVWVECYSEEHGRPYWVHRQTRQSSWVNPSSSAAQLDEHEGHQRRRAETPTALRSSMRSSMRARPAPPAPPRTVEARAAASGMEVEV